MADMIRKCPVGALECQRLAAARITEDIELRLLATPEGPGRQLLQMELAASKAIEGDLLEEMWATVAASEHGIVLQLISLYKAADEGDRATVERLDRHIREAVGVIARAIGARPPAQDGDAPASVRAH
jgi:hypothetical protein